MDTRGYYIPTATDLAEYGLSYFKTGRNKSTHYRGLVNADGLQLRCIVSQVFPGGGQFYDLEVKDLKTQQYKEKFYSCGVGCGKCDRLKFEEKATAFITAHRLTFTASASTTAPEATDMRCACEVDRDNGVTSMCFACTGPVSAAHPAPTAPEVTEEAGA